MKYPKFNHLGLVLPISLQQSSQTLAVCVCRGGGSVNHIKDFAHREKLTQPGREPTEEGNQTSVTGITPVHFLFVPLGSARLF